MNHLLSFEKYNFTEPKYTRTGRDYFFETDKWSYKISIYENQSNPDYPYVGFKAKEIGEVDFNYNMSVITNDNVYKVMSTIKEIVEDDFRNNSNKGYTFSFTGDEKKSNQRLKLYKKFLGSDWNIEYREDLNQFILHP